MATASELASAWIRNREFGFTRPIPEAGQRAFYQALLVCCNGDGVISPEEREWVVGKAAAIGVPDEIITELRTFNGAGDVETVLSQDAHESKFSRRALVYEAIRACGADGDYSEGERKTVIRLAHRLGLADTVVAELEDIVKQSDALRRKTIRTLFPDGSPY